MDEVLLYKTDNQEVKVEILLQNENLWFTQAKMAELFDVKIPAISKHLKNIFESGELKEDVVVSKMEITTWKNAPNGDIHKPDVSIAKNYLTPEEMKNLNEIVTMYLDYAERQAKRGQVMHMNDWVEKLNAFLQFNQEDILADNGKISYEIAKAFAESEFEKFRVIRDTTYKSDFDKLMEASAEYRA